MVPGRKKIVHSSDSSLWLTGLDWNFQVQFLTPLEIQKTLERQAGLPGGDESLQWLIPQTLLSVTQILLKM